MPPHNLFDSDCEAVPSMGQLFNSLLSNSINTFTPMCNDSASSPRVYSPTYPMNNPPPPSTTTSSSSASSKTARRPNGLNGLSVSTTAAGSAPDPRRPPLNPINHHHHHHHHKEYKKSTSFRERKKFGLSVDVPPHSSDPHSPRGVDNYNGNGDGSGHRSPISSPRNIELRRKSLSERHFFRPVSEDDESTIVDGKQ